MMTSLDIPIPEGPRVISREDNRAVFEIAGLYPGYGVTLGNALRRVLLSSLPGAAVTRIAIEGVPHEFTTIPGVKETVLEIVLNVKKLRLKLFSNEPQTLVLVKRGEGIATSDDLKVPAQVTIASKGLPIATLTDRKAELSMEFTVERGIGYLPADIRKDAKMPVGSIAVDAIFTPVREATFTVENMRVGDRTDYNRLRMVVGTDGTMTPDEALAAAAKILVQQFSQVIPEEFRGEERTTILREPLAVLGLSSRITSALEDAGIRTVAGLLRKRKKDLAELEGIGEKALEEIEKSLAKHDLLLKP
jgi:DNA-directed RNA polymerase subunit alpha